SRQLLACLELSTRLTKEFSRISTYASLHSDQDTRDSKYLAMTQEMSQIGSTFAAKSSFIEPEILKIAKLKIDEFVKGLPGLAVYKHYLDDILRRQAHTGTEGEEKIIADAGLMADGAFNIFSIFSNAE